MGLNQPEKHSDDLTDMQIRITKRAESATSIKVLSKASDLVEMGSNLGGQWGDVEIAKAAQELREELENPGFSGKYDGWSSKDIRELYSVLTGEEM